MGVNIAVKVVGAVRRINIEEIWCALSDMKNGKARGSSGVV